MSVYVPFTDPQASHEHALETLELLAGYDSFMESIDTLADFGCGSDALDLEWWATKTTRDFKPEPLNIKCTGIDLALTNPIVKKYSNVSYRSADLEYDLGIREAFDVVWCHNTFQYLTNPLAALRHWYPTIRDNGMLCIILPQATVMDYNRQAFDQWDYQYYNHTTVSMIHMLALNGFDCKNGFFKKIPNDPWLHCVVYKSEHEPMDPRATRWYDLADKDLLPQSAVDSLNKYGYVRQADLVLPWLDKNLTWLGHE